MRRAGAAPVASEHSQPKGESADQRDDRLEQLFTYDRRGERSTMAFVSVYRDELVEEFYAWREREYQLHRTSGEGVLESVSRWEVARFGSRLDAGPHGVLLFAVRCKLAPEHGGRRLPPGYFDRTPREVKGLPGNVVGSLPRRMAMPHVRQSRRETDARLMELEQQAKGLRLDEDGLA